VGITWLEPTDLGLTTTGAWTDVDVSASVPEGATGVILHIVNSSTTYYRNGVRKNGSSDNRNMILFSHSHYWTMVGVDADRVFEAYIANVAVDIYLVGYVDADAAFFTNGVNKSLSATAAWTDIDISANTDTNTAIGAIFEVAHSGATSSSYAYGLRKNGSTDEHIAQVYGASLVATNACAIIGVDESEVCEGYIANTAVDFYLLGYFMAGATFNTNGTDLSLTNLDAWEDLSALPAGATGAFIEVNNDSGGAYYYGLRENGSAEAIYERVTRHMWGIVKADANRVIEGEIGNTAIDFFLVGYANSGGPPVVTGAANLTGSGTIAASAVVTVFGAAELTGAGDITVDNVPVVAGAVNLTGAGDISAAATLTLFGAANLTGAGDITAAVIQELFGAVNLTGAGDLHPAVIPAFDHAVDLRWHPGTGDLEFWAVATNTLICTISASQLAIVGNVTGTVTPPPV
jgi:hypothetical protein